MSTSDIKAQLNRHARWLIGSPERAATSRRISSSRALPERTGHNAWMQCVGAWRTRRSHTSRLLIQLTIRLTNVVVARCSAESIEKDFGSRATPDCW